ncbi:MAG: MBL fold metallo-hydrolase [Aquabacterium sp.]|uniref:MBL fold metallo-hydrolase RNA specificity domain-containing protein n=1 Tax=Aquabacterium sp. TaxID=1872578 RepID=UPI001213BDA1|nr:MBL fold metallo-hydrolase [Aquabacterium sp.]TAK93045.1 MAG: MBL fold metallo-hydrolase [Aquabacterium sp.]
MRMTFYGATATVTGSKTLVEVGGLKLLVDCGMFQGFKTLRERNWAPLPFDPASLDAVLLTHAHIDHSGTLPLLTRQGFKGPIWTTSGTADLCEVLLQDTAHLQEEEAYYRNRHGKTRHEPAEPLYTVKDVKACLKHFHRVATDGAIELGQGVRVRFSPAGHILGAASIAIEYQGKTALFSGDLGREDDLVMQPPQTGQQADWVVIESTYGDRLHPAMDPIEKLGDVVRRTAARGGVVIIPAFAVGRTQGLLYALYRLKEAGAIPNLPVVLDSPMGISATGLYERHHNEHRLSTEECEGIRHMTRFVRDVEESKALLSQRYPMVIIAGSGMVTGGRVLHHIEHYGPHSRNAIVLSGFQAGGTRGASLAAGASSIKLFGEYVPIRAEVAQIEGLSAHADQAGLLNWLKGLAKQPEHVFINHGEPQAADTLRLRINEQLGWQASVPDYKDSVDLT